MEGACLGSTVIIGGINNPKPKGPGPPQEAANRLTTPDDDAEGIGSRPAVLLASLAFPAMRLPIKAGPAKKGRFPEGFLGFRV